MARAHALDLAARYDEGIKMARDAVAQVESIHYRPVEAEAQTILASLEGALGHFDQAKAAWHRALGAALAGRDDELAASAAIRLTYVVGVYQNHFDDADRWAELAESIIDRLRDKDELLGRLYVERSALRRRESRPDEGLSDAKKALELQLRVHGANHSFVADAYDALGRAYYQVAQYKLAIECHQKALEIEERALGADHPTVAHIRFGLANAYGDSGEHEHALAEYRRILAIFQRISPTHASLGVILNNIGDELVMIGKPEDALAEYQRARAFHELRGSSHDTVLLYNNIGEVELELNQALEAESYFKKALEMGERLLGPKSALCAVSRWGIAEASRRQGNLDGALADFQRTLPLAEKAFGATHPQVARPLVGIGRVYLRRHQEKNALAPLRQAVAILEPNPGDGAELAEARFTLAEALWASGERANARALATAAVQGCVHGGVRAARWATKIESWLADHR
jgi:tetratricopeptide (TPR) repeat protein